MSIEKHTDEDNETVASSTEKTDEPDESKSKATESDANDDDDDDDTSSNASSEYEVERILSKRKRRRGNGYEYYIKWVGYDDSANEWIPASSLNCPERLKEFHREEERKRKLAQQERNTSQKRRSRNSRGGRPKKRRTKVIKDNEDDEDEDVKNYDDDDEPAKSVDSPTSSEQTSTVNSVTYGIEKGYKVQAVLGINRTKGEQLHYLVHYESPTSFEDNMELIPADTAKKYCEDEIIQFYESRIAWNDRPND